MQSIIISLKMLCVRDDMMACSRDCFLFFRCSPIFFLSIKCGHMCIALRHRFLIFTLLKLTCVAVCVHSFQKLWQKRMFFFIVWIFWNKKMFWMHKKVSIFFFQPCCNIYLILSINWFKQTFEEYRSKDEIWQMAAKHGNGNH